MSDIKAFLFDDDRGVSPVIGVILMVAITVILAAVIAAFVLGLGDTNESAPSVTWEYDFEDNVDETSTAAELTVTHQGGDTIDGGNVEFGPGSGFNGTVSNGFGDDESYSAGDSVTLGSGVNDPTTGDSDFVPGETVTILFTSGDGSSSSIIGEFDVPDDFPN